MRVLFFITICLLLNCQLQGQSKTGYLTDDGAWCWFSDPRAILVDDYVITGWVKSDGTIEAAKFNVENQDIQKEDLYYRLEQDDHDNPAFVLTGNKKILALYTRHSMKDLFINSLENDKKDAHFTKPEFIHPLSKEELEKFPMEGVTYANPIRLKQENNRIYCFGRWAGFKPNMMWSDDNGDTWTKSKVFVTNYPFDTNNRPYVKYASDGNSKIHIVFTDGHPRDEPNNSVHYAYYENGSFYKANGQEICNMDSIPFEPKNASIVYTSNEKEGRAWVADIGQDDQGNPVILYTKSPTELNHEYWCARFTDQGWISKKICDSGKWFPQTPAGEKEREPHYFGGMTIHPDNCNVIYLSRQINNVFEIERWETTDSGTNWTSTPITQNSTLDNVRPFVPRGLKKTDPEMVLWMENQKYIHYTNFKTAIKYHIQNK